MYLGMAPVLQMYNAFRNRWCGAYWASKGMRGISTVSWGDESTFDFCFDGIEKGSTVAVSTYMVSEHGNHADQKEFFLKGYREMLRQVHPERIICYHEPFPEMEGSIVYVNYELSSWRHQNDEPLHPEKYVKYHYGYVFPLENRGIIFKQGTVLRRNDEYKGMGNPYGGKWRPSPKKT